MWPWLAPPHLLPPPLLVHADGPADGLQQRWLLPQRRWLHLPAARRPATMGWEHHTIYSLPSNGKNRSTRFRHQTQRHAQQHALLWLLVPTRTCARHSHCALAKSAFWSWPSTAASRRPYSSHCCRASASCCSHCCKAAAARDALPTSAAAPACACCAATSAAAACCSSCCSKSATRRLSARTASCTQQRQSVWLQSTLRIALGTHWI